MENRLFIANEIELTFTLPDEEGTSLGEVRVEKKDDGKILLVHYTVEPGPATKVMLPEIKIKMQKSWCPPKQIEMNPILEIVKYLIFHEVHEFTIERPTKYGGDVTFASYEEVESEYSKGNIHPQDLKNSVSSAISKIIEGVRKHFEEPANKQLMDVFKEVEITR